VRVFELGSGQEGIRAWVREGVQLAAWWAVTGGLSLLRLDSNEPLLLGSCFCVLFVCMSVAWSVCRSLT
jgi:hypothetical protein